MLLNNGNSTNAQDPNNLIDPSLRQPGHPLLRVRERTNQLPTPRERV